MNPGRSSAYCKTVKIFTSPWSTRCNTTGTRSLACKHAYLTTRPWTLLFSYWLSRRSAQAQTRKSLNAIRNTQLHIRPHPTKNTIRIRRGGAQPGEGLHRRNRIVSSSRSVTPKKRPGMPGFAPSERARWFYFHGGRTVQDRNVPVSLKRVYLPVSVMLSAATADLVRDALPSAAYLRDSSAVLRLGACRATPHAECSRDRRETELTIVGQG